MSHFNCQQFSVRQQQSGMKICTDGLLFGAMAPINAGDSVLDIGTGTGVLALCAAQLGAQQVTAIEITREAYDEASLNFSNSPWANRLTAVHQDIQSFAQTVDRQYDLIISNPPFFEQHSKAEDALRSIARHTDSLSFADLIATVEKLLSPRGLFYVLLPTHALQQFTNYALTAGFFLRRQVSYRGYEHTLAKVSALTFSRLQARCKAEYLTIYESKGVYTTASTAYLRPFLLRFTAQG
jgi:tRNA1Val (adenine37-N6)-methyltransferase